MLLRTGLCLLLLLTTSAYARVHMPTGEYRESAVDLRVKVRGGEVVIERTWQADDLNKGEYRWHPNPAWDDLRFELDVIDGVPKTILRSGSRFERGGNDIYIWQREYFIRAEKDAAGEVTGWRWYDREGNWITYGVDGRIASYGNRTIGYDALQRPTHIKSQAIGSGTHEAPTGAIIMDYRYQYDAAGNITQRETEEGAYQYGYDLIDRLTQATPPQNLQQNPATPEANKLPIEAYSYDPVHNRLSSQHQPGLWQYNQDNQLQNYGIGLEKHTYTYNPNGHTQTEVTGDPATKTREFIYNAAERLIEIKDNQQTIGQYQYDPMGRRIRKTVGSTTTWFLYADEGLIAELDQTGNPKRYYGWKPNGLWGTDPLWLADHTANGWQVSLYHNDHLWTPQRLTDMQGEVQWGGRAEAFGRTGIAVNMVENSLRFPGQYEDGETGAHYNYRRNYLPDHGRYAQFDPIGLLGGVNVYSYVSAPIMEFDNYGLVKWSGSVMSIGGAYGVGFSYNKINITSECKCGERWKLEVIVVGPTVLGIGAEGANPFGGTSSSMDFEDGQGPCPAPNQFEGTAMWGSGSLAALAGGGCSAFFFKLEGVLTSRPRFTGAYSVGCGRAVGIDASIGMSIGSSTIVGSEREECGCDE